MLPTFCGSRSRMHGLVLARSSDLDIRDDIEFPGKLADGRGHTRLRARLGDPQKPSSAFLGRKSPGPRAAFARRVCLLGLGPASCRSYALASLRVQRCNSQSTACARSTRPRSSKLSRTLTMLVAVPCRSRDERSFVEAHPGMFLQRSSRWRRGTYFSGSEGSPLRSAHAVGPDRR